MIYNQTLEKYTQNSSCKIFSMQVINAEHTTKGIHRHSFFQIILLRKGTLSHWIDFEKKVTGAPYISVVFPNQLHQLELSSEGEADIIMFDETVFCSAILSNELKEYNIDLQSRLNHLSNIPLEDWKNIQQLLGNIRQLSLHINSIRTMQIKFFIKIILLKIIDMAPMKCSITNTEADLLIYQKFGEAVSKNFATQRKVSYYANLLGISTKKLTAVCYKYRGESPLEMIHDKLSMELKKVVVENNMLLKEIAFKFGFSSQSALNKFIERHFACSPQVWRTELEKSMTGKI